MTVNLKIWKFLAYCFLYSVSMIHKLFFYTMLYAKHKLFTGITSSFDSSLTQFVIELILKLE